VETRPGAGPASQHAAREPASQPAQRWRLNPPAQYADNCPDEVLVRSPRGCGRETLRCSTRSRPRGFLLGAGPRHRLVPADNEQRSFGRTCFRGHRHGDLSRPEQAFLGASTRPGAAHLSGPSLGIAGITTSALLNLGITPAYTGFFTVAIFFIGSTQSERVTLASISIALPCWVVCQGGLTATVAVKVPVTVGVWVLIGSTLARRATRSNALTKELIRAAATDPLTGLASRGELTRLLGLIEEGDAVVLIDLDEFKALNDVRGHQAGDAALAAFGTIVREVLRAGDVAIRYGGDEILLVLTRAGSAGADAMLERLCARWSGVDHPTFSAGVAVCNHSTPTETLRRADEALYEAKQRGRNRWSHAEQVGLTGHLKVVQ